VRPSLVTGGGGFLGSWLAGCLARADGPVRILARRRDVPRRARRTGVEVQVGDVRDARAVREAVRGCRHVYHVAALFRDEGRPAREYWDVNVEGTRNVLEAAAAAGVERVVHCSTVGVHGPIDRPPAREDDPLAPDHVYEETKAEAERLALEYHRAGRVPVTVVRPTGIYGPGDLRLLKMFRLIQLGRFPIFGDGRAYTHLVYVTDLVQGMELGARHPDAPGRAFFIGGPRPVSVNELCASVARTLGVPAPGWRLPARPLLLLAGIVEDASKLVGVKPPIYRRRVQFFTKNRAYDISRARVELGFEPRVELAEGLRRTAAWYRRRGLLAPFPIPAVRPRREAVAIA
jgi:nucleoside-diphosphate-sugar epimerase